MGTGGRLVRAEAEGDLTGMTARDRHKDWSGFAVTERWWGQQSGHVCQNRLMRWGERDRR